MIATTEDPLGGPQESHEHPDNTGIVLYAHGELLALDSGYASWDKRWQTKESNNHNIVTIEGDLSFSAYGSGYLDHYFDTEYMDFAEVKTLIEVGYNEGWWLGPSYVDHRRSVLFPNHRYFVVVDALNPHRVNGRRQYHDYRWRLHGNGALGKDATSLDGSYIHLEDQGGVWARENGNLVAVVTTDKGAPAISHYPDVHALKWNDLKTHEVLSARKNITSSASNKDVRFLSVLYPAGAPDPLPTIFRLSVRDAAAFKIEEPEEAGGLTAIAMTKENWDSVTIPHAESGVGELETNGRILFARVDRASHELNQVFAKNVSYLEHGGGPGLHYRKLDLPYCPGHQRKPRCRICHLHRPIWKTSYRYPDRLGRLHRARQHNRPMATYGGWRGSPVAE
jgi:hypothetical protein